MAKRRILSVQTPLGYRVTLTRDRWREIVRFKHPALTGREREVEDCLRSPIVIRQSAKDADVHLYYAKSRRGYYVCRSRSVRGRRPIRRDGLLRPRDQERSRDMDRLRVYYDRTGNTLSVWFDDPRKEHVAEESDDDVVLVKDRGGRVIGFERLNFLSARQRKEGGRIPVEVQMG